MALDESPYPERLQFLERYLGRPSRYRKGYLALMVASGTLIILSTPWIHGDNPQPIANLWGWFLVVLTVYFGVKAKIKEELELETKDNPPDSDDDPNCTDERIDHVLHESRRH